MTLIMVKVYFLSISEILRLISQLISQYYRSSIIVYISIYLNIHNIYIIY